MERFGLVCAYFSVVAYSLVVLFVSAHVSAGLSISIGKRVPNQVF